MALKHPRYPLGRTVILDHDSAILRASIPRMLGDSPRRKLAVWLPPQYDAVSTTAAKAPPRFPVLSVLVCGMSFLLIPTHCFIPTSRYVHSTFAERRKIDQLGHALVAYR